jgi:hypothetical protein
MTTDEEDDEREFAPAEEVVYRMDVIIDALDVIERIIDSRPEGLVIPDADRRRMKALLLKMMREADELFDLGEVSSGAGKRLRCQRPREVLFHNGCTVA